MENKFTTTLAGKELSVSFNGLAEKVNGEALVRYGDTVVFATATMSDEETDKDFFPLSVNYEEKFYAAGKISGPRYTRREGKPSERATLVSRMIDRAIRPKFNKSIKQEVQVIVTCLSFDEENDPGLLGMIAASAALHVSDIPWEGPLGAVKIGKNEDYMINPVYEEKAKGTMEVVVSGFVNEKEEFITNMIEGSFKESSEKSIMKAFELAEDPIKQLCNFQEEIKEKVGKEKQEIVPYENKEVESAVREKAEKELEEALKGEEKEERTEEAKKRTEEFIEENYEEQEERSYALSYLEGLVEEKIRKNILDNKERLDGRAPEEIRDISCSAGFLPRTHGSGLFKRGQTKALSVVTLGAPGEQQLMDDMETTEEKKRFMHHYNFPPYSVGEVKPLRAPGRREIGHGMLAENAVAPLIPDSEEFPYTIRAVSEIVSSNGSTSMASVCGTSLALMDAGVPIKSPAAGISIGLITGQENYELLTDIQGLEDHCGDMDFKVAGTKEGITAIQLDVKIEGLTVEMMRETLQRAKEARIHILEKIGEVLSGPREELSPFAPRIGTIKIDQEKIGDVIGPKGKTINEIIEGTNVSIDIDDSTGLISISSENQESIDKAINWIKNLTREVKEGETFQGKVVKILGFGAIVEILPGQEGLVHISEIAEKRVESVEDELKVGQIVPVKVISVDDSGKISLSMKEAKKEQ